MREQIEKIMNKVERGDLAYHDAVEEILLLFSVSKRSSCCNASIDTDEQSCEICSNCGERL